MCLVRENLSFKELSKVKIKVHEDIGHILKEQVPNFLERFDVNDNPCKDEGKEIMN